MEIVNLFIGALVLLLGFPLGDYLAKSTKEELKSGQKWFKFLILLGCAGALIGLVYKNDSLFFAFAFIAIVTSRSLREKKK